MQQGHQLLPRGSLGHLGLSFGAVPFHPGSSTVLLYQTRDFKRQLRKYEESGK